VTLAATGPDIVVLPRGTRLYRLFFRGGPYPAQWNTMRAYGPLRQARFDHHMPPPHVQRRAVYYAATSIAICIAEVFQRNRLIDRRSADPWIAAFDLDDDLALLDLCGLWPTRAGASQAISSSPHHARSRRWSQAVYEAFHGAVSGMRYRSSMYRGDVSVVLYESGAGALPAGAAFEYPLIHPGLVAALDHLSHSLEYRLV
jgi:hypothetical protein